MTNVQRLFGVAIASGLALTFVSIDYARPQVRTQTTVETRREPGQAHETRRVKNILGSKIHITGNVDAGTVEDIVLNEDGLVEYLVVANEGKMVLLPWEAARWDWGRRVATVEITRERYHEIPTFVHDQWPNVYDTGYRERIYGYYGVKPGQIRRIERREGIRK